MTFVVVGRTACPYCDATKTLLDGKHISYTYFDVTDTASPLRQFIKAIGLHTVPQIWNEGGLIGGYDDLQKYIDDNDLGVQPSCVLD